MAATRRAKTMEETRTKLVTAARDAFARHGYAGASMDDLTAAAGVTRGALYHNFGDKKGLLAAVVTQIDGEMARKAERVGAETGDAWDALIAQGIAYIEMALDPDVQRIVLLDGPAVLGDPSHWPSQSACLEETRRALSALMEAGEMRRMDIEAAARLLNGAALNAALWIANSKEPQSALPKAIDAFKCLASGFRGK